jgi:penicillin-insensitive murein endopeptidase
MRRIAYFVAALAVLTAVILAWGNTLAIALESPTSSRSIGTPAQGRLVHGKRLPTSGPNFAAYSRLGAAVGRNGVHSTIRAAIIEAYHTLERSAPHSLFVYGETGWPSGGRFRPHRTHQNGLSADFMVPVRGADGDPVWFPTRPWTRFGYDIEFDSTGFAGHLRIDFDAIAFHLAALDQAARRRGSAIERVIFAPELERALKDDAKRRNLVGGLPFMRARPWVRHDEHYHVDFTNPSRP